MTSKGRIDQMATKKAAKKPAKKAAKKAAKSMGIDWLLSAISNWNIS